MNEQGAHATNRKQRISNLPDPRSKSAAAGGRESLRSTDPETTAKTQPVRRPSGQVQPRIRQTAGTPQEQTREPAARRGTRQPSPSQTVGNRQPAGHRPTTPTRRPAAPQRATGKRSPEPTEHFKPAQGSFDVERISKEIERDARAQERREYERMLEDRKRAAEAAVAAAARRKKAADARNTLGFTNPAVRNERVQPASADDAPAQPSSSAEKQKADRQAEPVAPAVPQTDAAIPAPSEHEVSPAQPEADAESETAESTDTPATGKRAEAEQSSHETSTEGTTRPTADGAKAEEEPSPQLDGQGEQEQHGAAAHRPHERAAAEREAKHRQQVEPEKHAEGKQSAKRRRPSSTQPGNDMRTPEQHQQRHRATETEIAQPQKKRARTKKEKAGHPVLADDVVVPTPADDVALNPVSGSIVAREFSINRASLTGVIVNIVLFIMKLVCGILANSVSVIASAVESGADALSNGIALAGTRLSQDNYTASSHPIGFGRGEYFMTTLLSAAVLLSGVVGLVTSIGRILTPVDVRFSMITVIGMAIATIASLALWRFRDGESNQLDSDKLRIEAAGGVWSIVASFIALAAVAVGFITNLPVDGWTGAVLSAFLIKVGIDLIRKALDRILSSKVDADLAYSIKCDIEKFRPIRNTYDLILRTTRSGEITGSAEVELPDTMPVGKSYKLLRRVQSFIYSKYGIYIVFSIYAVNTTDRKTYRLERDIKSIIMSHDYIKAVHAFVIEPKRHLMSFDVVAGYGAPPDDVIRQQVVDAVQDRFPTYAVAIVVDRDYA